MYGRRAAQEYQGRDVVHVDVASGYKPAVVTVRAGVPIRVVFHRHDDDPCADRVVFSSPRIERRLAEAGETPVDIPARPPGDIRYTCGMGRYSGTIRVSAVADDRLQRLRHIGAAMGSAATVIVIIVAVGLPIVAALALLSLDSWTAAAATAAAAVVVAVAVFWLIAIPSAGRDPDRGLDVTKDGLARSRDASDARDAIRHEP